MVLILVNAFFVAAEMALARIRRTRIDQLADEGNKTAKIIQYELSNPERFISACQLGITLATLGLGAMGEKTFAEDLSRGLAGVGFIPDAVKPVAQAFAFFAAFTFTAFLQTVFGELLPKTLTFSRAEPIMMATVHPMRFWCFLTAPFLVILNNCTAIILRLMNVSEPPRKQFVPSGEELKLLVSASHEEGVLEENEEELLHSVFDFSDTVAHEVMTPSTDMIALSANATVREFVELALKHGFSRIPVFESDMDNIFGFVHIRDGLRALFEHKEASLIRELARKVLIVPENKDAGDLLQEFQKNKSHMAIVVDEYGGTRGLVTIEDLLEELVGDIADEHDIIEDYQQVMEDGTVVLDAKMALDDFNERYALDIKDEEFNTLGGHVFGLLGREPQPGDEVEEGAFTLRVEEADRHRIVKLRLIRKNLAELEEKNDSGAKTDSNGKMKHTGEQKAVETSK